MVTLRHGLELGRTRKKTRRAAAGEMSEDPERALNVEEALLATVLETEKGSEIAAENTNDSLVEDRRQKEQARRAHMEELYGLAAAELSRELDEVAFGAEIDDDGCTQRPELSIPSPIGQKPSDVGAVPMTYKDVLNSEYTRRAGKRLWGKRFMAMTRPGLSQRSAGCPRGRRQPVRNGGSRTRRTKTDGSSTSKPVWLRVGLLKFLV